MATKVAGTSVSSGGCEELPSTLLQGHQSLSLVQVPPETAVLVVTSSGYVRLADRLVGRGDMFSQSFTNVIPANHDQTNLVP